MRYLGAAVVALATSVPALGGVVFDQPAETKPAPFVDQGLESDATAVFSVTAFRDTTPGTSTMATDLGRLSLGESAIADVDIERALTDSYSFEYSGERATLSTGGSITSRVARMAPTLGAVTLLGLAGALLVLRPRH